MVFELALIYPCRIRGLGRLMNNNVLLNRNEAISDYGQVTCVGTVN